MRVLQAFIAAAAMCLSAAAESSVVGLAVDHLVEPGDRGAAPSFAWRMETPRRGAAQKAYRIRVFEGARVAWDSGEVAESRSVGIRYGGEALKPASRYSWLVSVKDERGEWTTSPVAAFTTALFDDREWDRTPWISAVDSKVSAYPSGKHDRIAKQEAEDGTSCFVKSVRNESEVVEAWLAVSGLGVFEAYVNGQPVSRKLADGTLERDFLKPGFTHCAKTKHYFTYDVTHLVNRGAGEVNTIAAQVSAGWWRDKIVNFAGKKSAFRAMFILRHADGGETRVATDETWLSAVAGPVLRAAIHDGEDYDARVSQEWMTGAGLNGFKPSEVNREFKGVCVPMEGAGVCLRRDLALFPVGAYVWEGIEGASEEAFGKVAVKRRYGPGERFTIEPGETLIVDFGQNSAMVPEFAFSAAAGTVLSMRPAEMLNDGNGAKSRGCDGPEGSIYRESYRRARSMVNYTFAGNGVETYHPEFTFFGGRYASITATGKVEISSVRAIPVTSVWKSMETGTLSTGDADVNKLVSNALWGEYSNYLSVPTDCPQRNERIGWTADAQVFALAGAYNADTYGFFTKWMRDMRDSQHADGSYTGVAPLAQYGDDGHRLGWADAGVIVPYVMWRQFGDTAIVEENWDSMKRYMALLDEMKYESPQARHYQWADWLSFEKLESRSKAAFIVAPDGTKTPRPEALVYWQYLGCCYWLWDSRMMAEMADACGRDAEAKEYREMADRAFAFIRAKFVDKSDGMLIPLFRDMQTPALFALKLGLIDTPSAIAATKAALFKNIKAHNECLQTGFLGTSIIMDVLTYDAGAPETAYSLLLQHGHPSWLYTVDQGATTFWERWNSYTKERGFGPSDMNSFNHYAYGAVVAWMYGTMAGIQAGPEGGYKHFVLAPVPDPRMGKVDAVFLSPYGAIKSAWEYGADGKCTWRFTIPANTSATVKLPGGKEETLEAGTYIRYPFSNP